MASTCPVICKQPRINLPSALTCTTLLPTASFSNISTEYGPLNFGSLSLTSSTVTVTITLALRGDKPQSSTLTTNTYCAVSSRSKPLLVVILPSEPTWNVSLSSDGISNRIPQLGLASGSVPITRPTSAPDPTSSDTFRLQPPWQLILGPSHLSRSHLIQCQHSFQGYLHLQP